MRDYKQETLNFYDKHAEALAKKFTEMFDLNRRKEFGFFLDNLKGKKILDVGCGNGEHMSYFKEKGLDVIGIDFSSSMIEISLKRGLNVHQMDMEDLKFKDNEFDGIWAVNSLLHIDKNKFPKVIAELSRILKPDGLLYVRVKEGEDEGMVIESHYNNEARFFSFWKKDELLPIFEKYFSLVKFDRIEFKGTVYLEFFFGHGK